MVVRHTIIVDYSHVNKRLEEAVMSNINSPLKLYITPTSPYARLARIVVLEKKLDDKVEQIIAKTRQTDSPYYQVNPSGRVPCLILPDGTRLEESQLVCSYLDQLDTAPQFETPTGTAGLQVRRLEAMARSLMDGVSAVSYTHLTLPTSDLV